MTLTTLTTHHFLNPVSLVDESYLLGFVCFKIREYVPAKRTEPRHSGPAVMSDQDVVVIFDVV